MAKRASGAAGRSSRAGGRRKTTTSRKPTKADRAKVRVCLAVSLDGYLADANEGVAWLDPHVPKEMDFAAYVGGFGAVVMGRKTFDFGMAHGGDFGVTGPTVVLTRRKLVKAPEHVEAYRGDLKKLVERLRRRLRGTGKDIWLMGGGEAIDAFLSAGLVDRLELTVIPTLVGDGVPLFPPHSRGLHGLRFASHRIYSNGVVELCYEPARRKRRPQRPAKTR